MKLLDYTLICILTGVVRVAGAQTPPPTEPTSPPSKATESAPGDGGNTVNCDDGGCDSDQGVLFELRTRGERKPITHGTSEKSSSEVLQPDRRVTVEAEDVNSAWQNKPLPGKAVVVGKWSLQLPGGDKLLLHSCCAPCSGELMEAFVVAGIDYSVLFYNPNIHPIKEYELRKEENIRFAQKHGVPFIDADYD
ncbi:epoxyqueuosine reductase QueH, partial [Lysobacter sp. 2RAB21]